MKSLFFLCVLLALYGTTVSVIREYFYSSQVMNLTTAENYCREKHGILAHITTEEEFNKASVVAPNSPLSWIGLKRSAPYVNIWKWPNGEIANFTKWITGEPDGQNSDENCIGMNKNGWYDVHCSTNRHTLCSRSFTLVKEKKTWEEALQHCKNHYTDLVFVDSEKMLEDLRTGLKTEAETVSVWTGLRFLNGKWFWVNGVPMESLVSLPPQCPVRPYHCGSYNINTSLLENRDCNEMLTFLCY